MVQFGHNIQFLVLQRLDQKLADFSLGFSSCDMYLSITYMSLDPGKYHIAHRGKTKAEKMVNIAAFLKELELNQLPIKDDIFSV